MTVSNQPLTVFCLFVLFCVLVVSEVLNLISSTFVDFLGPTFSSVCYSSEFLVLFCKGVSSWEAPTVLCFTFSVLAESPAFRGLPETAKQMMGS